MIVSIKLRAYSPCDIALTSTSNMNCTFDGVFLGNGSFRVYMTAKKKPACGGP